MPEHKIPLRVLQVTVHREKRRDVSAKRYLTKRGLGSYRTQTGDVIDYLSQLALVVATSAALAVGQDKRAQQTRPNYLKRPTVLPSQTSSNLLRHKIWRVAQYSLPLPPVSSAAAQLKLAYNSCPLEFSSKEGNYIDEQKRVCAPVAVRRWISNRPLFKIRGPLNLIGAKMKGQSESARHILTKMVLGLDETQKCLHRCHASKSDSTALVQVGVQRLPFVPFKRTRLDVPRSLIPPQVVAMGTISHRMIEKTWLTPSNVKKNRVESESRAMVRAPPGYAIIGAGVNLEEWISSCMGGRGIWYTRCYGIRADDSLRDQKRWGAFAFENGKIIIPRPS
ncbi:hypothetical protein F5887DRAFT_1216101 [Amanita rubescens]|nr:hypothetical protein F5887DRAFT_1216101 [Amanita rubescens]